MWVTEGVDGQKQTKWVGKMLAYCLLHILFLYEMYWKNIYNTSFILYEFKLFKKIKENQKKSYFLFFWLFPNTSMIANDPQIYRMRHEPNLA